MLACTADDRGKLSFFNTTWGKFSWGCHCQKPRKEMDGQTTYPRLYQDSMGRIWEEPVNTWFLLLSQNRRTKQHLRKLRITSAIPEGMTSILQPLDVSINKPMKCLLRKKWNDWMLNGDRYFTKSEPAKTRIVNSVPMNSLVKIGLVLPEKKLLTNDAWWTTTDNNR